MAHSPAGPSEPEQAVRTSAGGPEKSCCLSFCRDLVRSFPGIFNFHGRSHPTLVFAATGKTLELSRAAGKFPGALDGDLSAGSGDAAFKNAEVAVAVRMLVDEVAALRTIACNKVAWERGQARSPSGSREGLERHHDGFPRGLGATPSECSCRLISAGFSASPVRRLPRNWETIT